MIKNKLLLVFLTVSPIVFSQVGIGTTTPRAALEINSATNGFLTPQIPLTITTASAPVVNPTGAPLLEGTIVYNTANINDVTPGYYYWNGTIWVRITAGSVATTPHNTLDKAYDEGGAGVGRMITADSGPVEITNAGTNTTALKLTTNIANSYAIYADQNNTGTTIRATNSFTGNNAFSTIQGRNNTSNISAAGILGLAGGAGFGVVGQTDATSTSRAGVYGINARTSGGHGVWGIGFNGVVGETNYRQGFGTWGENYNSLGSGNGVGAFGRGFVGVWGEIQSGYAASGYAGYFNGYTYSTVGFYAPSDVRLKSNIEKITNATSKLAALSGNHYDIKFDVKYIDKDGKLSVTHHNRKEYGVIAQEVEKLFPEMINEAQFDFTDENATKYKSVNYNQLIPVLLEAIKELNNRVTALESELKK